MPRDQATAATTKIGVGIAIVAPALIVAPAFLIYIPVLYKGFVFDDHTPTETNQILKAPNGRHRLCFTT